MGTSADPPAAPLSVHAKLFAMPAPHARLRRLSAHLAAKPHPAPSAQAAGPQSFDEWVTGDGPYQVTGVNAAAIPAAIALACRGAMVRVFNRDDPERVPFFGSSVFPVPELLFSTFHSESHIPGRHLNALLNAEHAAGLEVDEGAVEQHARAAFFSYSVRPLPSPTPHPTATPRPDCCC